MSARSSHPAGSDAGTARMTTFGFLGLGGLAVLLYGSVVEICSIASGTGAWYADFSAKWFAALAIFSTACIAVLVIFSVGPLRRSCARSLVVVRARAGGYRVAFAVILIAAPVLLLQYTPWGVVIRGPFLRLLLWAACAAGVAWALCGDRNSVWTAQSLLGATILSGSVLVVGAAFTNVTSYPFSLGWSEGNRLWDYSLAFGKSLYRFDPADEPVAYLDIGRQIIGGLPFLLGPVSIMGARLWLALVAILPYILVGQLAFFPRRRTRSRVWIIAGLFGLLFLSQGPIHSPLVVCAILVLLAWHLPVWWGAPLLLVSGYFAETSRFTWMFAPTMWIVLLELVCTTPRERRIPRRAWRRAIILGASGLLGSAIAFAGIVPWSAATIGTNATVSTSQALLWYRLLPNATYADGILLGLLRAAGPLVVVLVFAWNAYGQRSQLQALVVVAVLVSFLLVGLIVSAKIGGGGDLHNLDMFLIGLLLTAAILWQIGGEEWLNDLNGMPLLVQVAAALTLAIPGFAGLMSLRPISFAADAAWISVLVGAEQPRDLGSLPDAPTVDSGLEQIRTVAAEAAREGPVLLMDQRQLLTFGYLSGVKLVPEYEKKRLMDEALSGNAAYFGPFYQDLAEKRFALIVSSPLRTPIKDRDYGFGEENNAWVQWVAKPVLCYYERLDTLNELKVELLVPSDDTAACASLLPGSHP